MYADSIHTIYYAQPTNCFAVPETDGHLDPVVSPPNAEVRMDLEHILRQHRNVVMFRYASFVSCLCMCVQSKGVTVPDLRTFLLRLPAFTPDKNKQHKEQEVTLLSYVKDKLEEANTINKIFDLIGDECASFLNYDIFKFVLDEYCTTEDFDKNPKLKYSEHLNSYINQHKISEFFKINPELEKYTDTSTKLKLKLDVDATAKVTKIFELKSAVAAILGIIPSALRLYGIEDGCVITVYLLSTFIKDAIFVPNKEFSPHQFEEFCSLSVLWLECEEYKFDFRQSPFELSPSKKCLI